MGSEQSKLNRRQFLKTAGATGITSVLGVTTAFGESKTSAADSKNPKKGESEKPKFPQVPKRKLGKTGVEVPVLSLGAMFNVIDNQIALKKSIDWGVTYWDTAYMYAKGNSELGIGKFLKKNPKVRKKLFIVSKASGAKTPKGVEKRLQTSLERMNTKYIDLYYGVHALSDPAKLTNELKQWSLDAKKRKLIRFFGFSTHTNMAECLMAASKLDWIDAIMITYNFREMQDPKMIAAVEACHKADIGLIAMKTQAKGPINEIKQNKKLADKLLQRGFTEGQAKIKMVLQDEKIASACVGMKNIALLTSNVAAVLDKTKLTRSDVTTFEQHAKATCGGYCAGCASICDSTQPDAPYIRDVMRYLMYNNSYGDKNLAKNCFAQIPADVRSKLTSLDYSLSEARCPNNLPIAKLVREAVRKLA
jgi:uncharacterized protein